MKEFTLKYLRDDLGNCRVYFKCNLKKTWCIQDTSRTSSQLYVCSKDGEPSYNVERDFKIIDSNLTASMLSNLNADMVSAFLKREREAKPCKQ